MAQVILSSIGRALGGRIGATIGNTIGSTLDRAALASLQPARQTGPRLRELHLMSAAEGAPMAAVFGRARVAGQVIWAARFKERRIERQAGGGKGGPKTVEYRYSLSFAVALCEGPIDGIGRVWADGRPMDLSGGTMRLYRGGEDQTPDPLIEAVEGTAPAFGGAASGTVQFQAAYGDTAGMPYPEYALLGSDRAFGWWDPDTEGISQAANIKGKGVMMYLNEGRRYTYKDMPKTEPRFFDAKGSVNEVSITAQFADGVVPDAMPCTGCPSSGGAA